MSQKKPKTIVLRGFMEKPTSHNQGWANAPKLMVPMGPGHVSGLSLRHLLNDSRASGFGFTFELKGR